MASGNKTREGREKSQLPVVFQDAYDLTLWYARHTVTFPKNFRFTLADRIQERLFTLVLALYRASMNRQREDSLCIAQDAVDEMRVWNRLARDLKCISPRQYSWAACTSAKVQRVKSRGRLPISGVSDLARPQKTKEGQWIRVQAPSERVGQRICRREDWS